MRKTESAWNWWRLPSKEALLLSDLNSNCKKFKFSNSVEGVVWEMMPRSLESWPDPIKTSEFLQNFIIVWNALWSPPIQNVIHSSSLCSQTLKRTWITWSLLKWKIWSGRSVWVLKACVSNQLQWGVMLQAGSCFQGKVPFWQPWFLFLNLPSPPAGHTRSAEVKRHQSPSVALLSLLSNLPAYKTGAIKPSWG